MKCRIMLALTAGLIATGSFHLRAQDTDLAAVFRSASDRIHDAIVRDFTGDADVDFVMAMIPHYEGSIDMARIALEYGKDPQIRQLAEHIVNDHRAEREAMLEWIESDGGRL
jgi:uncharacterized protein (DUF305 family)